MQIVNNLKSNFLKTFHDEEEMSMQISSMKALVGYPDWIDNETFLNSHYGEVSYYIVPEINKIIDKFFLCMII